MKNLLNQVKTKEKNQLNQLIKNFPTPTEDKKEKLKNLLENSLKAK